MKIQNLKIDTESVVVLGAGATRGAECFEGSIIAAPVDSDFFPICQRLAVFEQSLEKLLEFARQEFPSLINVRMEQFFTTIESLDQFYEVTKITPGPTVKRYRKQLEAYPAHIASIFRILQNFSPNGLLSCRYHDKLASILSPKDSIISFNYDCIMDNSLKETGRKKWNPERGYGVAINQGTSYWKNHSGKGRVATQGILLLKLHGSLNWDRSAGPSIILRQDPYAQQSRSISELVPPVWNKKIETDVSLQEIWKKARKALTGAKTIAFIGYSIPQTDLFTQSLLHVSAIERTLSSPYEHVIIVNPDISVFDKVVTLLRGSINEKTRFHTFSSFRDFADII